MGKTTRITCDSCGNDLTFTGNCEDYYLVVENRSKKSRGGFVTLMALSPPLKLDLVFCGLRCLDDWTARRQYADELRKAWWDGWKDEHGTKVDGRVISYIGPSADVEAARELTIAGQVDDHFRRARGGERPLSK